MRRWLWAALGAAGVACVAQAGGTQVETIRAEPTRVAAEVDTIAVDAALAELDAAGSPATTAEIAEILAGSGSTLWGVFAGRVVLVPDRGWTPTGRLQLSHPFWNVRIRWRPEPQNEQALTGAAAAGRDNFRVVLGQMALSQGFGLLVAGPGRGPTLTADGSLAGRGRGLVPWAGQVQKQTLVGSGLAVGRGRWLLQAMAGRRQSGPLTGRQAAVGRLVRHGERGLVSLALLTAGQERGLSLAGNVAQAGLAASWEAVWRRQGDGGPGSGSILVQGAWHEGRRLLFSIAGGWAGLGPRPEMGAKQPVFGDWRGAGVVVRGRWRPVPGWRVQALFHRAHSRPETGHSRRRHLLGDVQIEGGRSRGWFGGARLRSAEMTTSTWSERFPWQIPAPVEQRRWQVLSVRFGWQGASTRCQALWRQMRTVNLRREREWEDADSRSLLGLSVRIVLGAGWVLRTAWTMAWGGEADLVSAAVPFAGYVLPRHWGHWSRESLLGAEYGHGALRWRGAVSRREQVPDPGPAASTGVWTIWLEGGWYW